MYESVEHDNYFGTDGVVSKEGHFSKLTKSDILEDMRN